MGVCGSSKSTMVKSCPFGWEAETEDTTTQQVTASMMMSSWTTDVRVCAKLHYLTSCFWPAFVSCLPVGGRPNFTGRGSTGTVSCRACRALVSQETRRWVRVPNNILMETVLRHVFFFEFLNVNAFAIVSSNVFVDWCRASHVATCTRTLKIHTTVFVNSGEHSSCDLDVFRIWRFSFLLIRLIFNKLAISH